MAKHLGCSEFTARDKLRKAGVSASGPRYAWSSRKALEADAAKVKKPEAKKPAGKAVKAPAVKAIKKAPEKKAA